MKNTILAGDFNCIPDLMMDSKTGAQNYNHSQGIQELSQTIHSLGLVDAWRLQNPQTHRFTWHNKRNFSVSRIDRIYKSSLLSAVSRNDILACPFSDHDLVVAFLDSSKNIRGKGYWKLNTSHLQDPAFVDCINYNWDHLIDQKQNFCHLTDWWDYVKSEFKRVSVSFSADKARQLSCDRKELLKRISSLQSRVDNGNDDLLNDLCNARSRFVKSFAFASSPSMHAKRDVPGENCSYPVTTGFADKCMSGLRNSRGQVTSDPVEIVEICSDFYQNLYTDVPIVQHEIDSLLSSVDSSLNFDESNLLEGDISVLELQRALSDMVFGKSPGSDGLPAEFYRSFFDKNGPSLCEVFNFAFRDGQLSFLQREGIITLLF